MEKVVEGTNKSFSVILSLVNMLLISVIIIHLVSDYSKYDDYSNKLNVLEGKVDDLDESIKDVESKVYDNKETISNIKDEQVKEVVEDVEIPSNTFSLSHYTAECKGCTGITYSGVDVRNKVRHNGRKIVAVDPNVIPLGSILEITNGEDTFKAQALDIGGAIKGNKLDLLVDSREKAIRYGRVDVDVKVIREGW